ncbi:G-protein coupled receptor Mth2 isoform X1 [Neodiprion lecontei]|uniref:G-protein coupled receptor Mth2 isoform X1 n=1 Tax=Neodiprion lecontei TaxID=441921 RepID=A0ABM3GMX7_NEOLC|nr:G-protein coupled receptor Mth2 isoform X1 [Neodiprion lecontei]
MSLQEGKLILSVIAILLLHANSCGSVNYCCPENTTWLNASNCSDGSLLPMNCPSGMFKLDSLAERFEIIEEKLLYDDGLSTTPMHRFCLASHPGMDNASIAVVCFEKLSMTRSLVFGTLCTLSAFFLLVTLIVYAVLPELRDLQGKILMCAMSSLLGAYILLAVVQLRPDYAADDDTLCSWTAFTMYYCFMAAFFWLNLVAFNVWRSAWFTRTVIKDEIFFWMYTIIGWGAPSIFLTTTIVGHHTDGIVLAPGFDGASCWFAGSYERWVYMYGPVAFLMTLNIVYFSLTCYQLWHKYRSLGGTRLDVMKFRCKLYLKLASVMGITWIFEVLSSTTGSEWLQYWLVTDVINSLQGFIIFLLLIASRKRVRKLLAKKKPFGINFPKRWAAGEDEESEVILEDDEQEQELSQTG